MRRLAQRRWWVLAIGAVVVTAVLAGALVRRIAHRGPGAEPDETWARIRREGILRVGMDATYPPFELQEGGEPRGYDVELAREIGRRLGLQVVFVNSGFDGLYDALTAGRCDLLLSALPYEEQRTRDVFYSGGYFNAGQVLVGRLGDAGIKTHADLAGRRVAVEMGSAAHQEALRLRDREQSALAIEAVQSSDEAFDLLQAGKVDAALADAVTARLALRKRPGLTICGPALTDESYVIAARRDSPQLFAAVNGTLNGLRGEGWLDRLAERWL